MKGRVFFDTNILIYCFEYSDTRKQQVALTLVSQALDQGVGVISWQVIQEFYNVALHKFKMPLSVRALQSLTSEFLYPMCSVFPTKAVWEEALLLQQQTQYRYFDSLILASALMSGAETLYSEDLQDGRQIGGLTIQNPFN